MRQIETAAMKSHTFQFYVGH